MYGQTVWRLLRRGIFPASTFPRVRSKRCRNVNARKTVSTRRDVSAPLRDSASQRIDGDGRKHNAAVADAPPRARRAKTTREQERAGEGHERESRRRARRLGGGDDDDARERTPRRRRDRRPAMGQSHRTRQPRRRSTRAARVFGEALRREAHPAGREGRRARRRRRAAPRRRGSPRSSRSP